MSESEDRQPVTQRVLETLAEQMGHELISRQIQPALPAAECAAHTLGPYSVTGHLGEGGMGQVFQVLDKDLQRMMAAKVMRGSPDPGVYRRFIQEAQLTGQLEHPNIVPVYSLGISDGERVYFTMKQVQGEDLGEKLARLAHEEDSPHTESQITVGLTERIESRIVSHLPHELLQLLQVFLKVCDAIAFAHSHGVIHRDLKPANIMVGAFGEVQVMDWGLAKLVHDNDRAEPPPTRQSTDDQPSTGKRVSSAVLTADGAVVGTPAFMPPEQAKGLIRELDQRSDIYSLGAILYQILTLELPFDGSDLRQLLDRVISGNPLPPKKRRPDRQIPWELEKVVLKAMAPKKKDRYDNVTQLQQDIHSFLAGRPLAAVSYRPWQRLAKWVARHRAATLASLVVVAVLVTQGVSWYLEPGSYTFDITPTKASVRFAGQQWMADRLRTIELPAGVHQLEIEAPDHAPYRLELTVERGKAKEFRHALIHYTGKIIARSWPPGSEINIDGQDYGSRLPNISLRTGQHTLTAAANRHQVRQRRFKLHKGESAKHYVWLEKAVTWMHKSPTIQRLPELAIITDLPWVEGPAIAYGTLNHLVVRSCRNKAATRSWLAANNSRWYLRELDLGGDLGLVLITHADQQEGLRVQCVEPREQQPRWVWNQQTAAREAGRPAPEKLPSKWWGQLCRVPDLTGDQIAELAVAGRRGDLWILDGDTGRPLRSPFPIPHRPTSLRGVALLAPSGPPHLLSVGYNLPAAKDSGKTIGPGSARCLRISDGKEIWQTKLGDPQTPLINAQCVDADGDGCLDVFWATSTRCGVLDGRTGQPRWSGTLPAPWKARIQNMELMELTGDGLVEGILYGSNAHSIAVLLKDGTHLWNSQESMGHPALLLSRSPNGDLLLSSKRGLISYQAASKQIRWRLPQLQPRLLLADWDGDGKQEIIAGFYKHGLVICVSPAGKELWRMRLDGEFRPMRTLPDSDKDGMAEFVVLEGSSQVGIIRGPRMLWRREAQAPLLATPQVADIDGDGRLEVIQSGRWRHERRLACYDGATGAVRWFAHHGPTSNRPPAVGDWDGDGLPELAFTQRVKHQSYWKVVSARNDTRLPLLSLKIEGGEDYATPAIADLNRDGQPDLVVQRWYAREILALDGRTSKPLWRHPTDSNNMGGLAVGPLTGDGTPYVVAPSLDGHVYALRGADGQVLWKTAIKGGSKAVPIVRDLEGDGTLEVLLTTNYCSLVVLEGKTGQPLHKTKPITQQPSWGRPVVAKLPGSAQTLVFAALGPYMIAFDWQRRRVLWRSPPGLSIIASPAVADLDGDGRLEVVVGGMRYRDRVLVRSEMAVLDAASGKLLWLVPVGTYMIEADPVVRDLNGDKILDILIATHGGQLHAISGLGNIGARRRFLRRKR